MDDGRPRPRPYGRPRRGARRGTHGADRARGQAASCDAYGIADPGEGLAESADEAVRCAAEIGCPVVMKIVSPDILHKTEAGGVLVGVDSRDERARRRTSAIVAQREGVRRRTREIDGVQVQQLLPAGQEVIVGAVTDPTFGKVVAFGLGGVLVEVLKDVTFRLAPVDRGRGAVDAGRHPRGRDAARRARRAARRPRGARRR